MGTIICCKCQNTIEHFEHEKVTILYSTCPHCKNKKIKK